MRARTLPLGLLLTLACDANVVDAVREPIPVIPVGGSASSGRSGSGSDNGGGGSGGGGSGGDVVNGGDGGSETSPPLNASLLHRYSFDGEGNTAFDLRGALHGQVVGTTLGGDGTLPLAGGSTDQYLNLPNMIVSVLTDATFEAWLTWHGGNAWHRIFDFGSNSRGEDVQGPSARSYLFLTPATARMAPSTMRLAYSQNGVEDEEICNAESDLPLNVLVHVVAVVNAGKQTMALYQDGALLVECPLTRPLSAIDDVNNWLGRSNYSDDADLAGVYEEFRIYGSALSAEEIAESFAAGPNAAP